MIKLFTLTTMFLLLGCTSAKQELHIQPGTTRHDNIFHYSVLKALDNGVLEGTMKVSELREHGDLGLGTFNFMDGEMIVIDHVVYRIAQDGRVLEAGDEIQIPYSVVSFYTSDDTLQMNGKIDYTSLKAFAEERLPSKNQFYAFRIYGLFDYIRCGGANAQEKPYDKSLTEMLSSRPVYEKDNVRGTLVGFWCPPYVGDINTSGFHLHFLADDHTIGGHLMDFSAGSLEIGYDVKSKYEIVLPETDLFRKAFFRDAPVNY